MIAPYKFKDFRNNDPHELNEFVKELNRIMSDVYDRLIGKHELISHDHKDTGRVGEKDSRQPGDLIVRDQNYIWRRIPPGSRNQVLTMGNVLPYWSNISSIVISGGGATSSVGGTGLSNHNILSAVHPDTVAGTVVKGDLIYGNSTPAWTKLDAGNNGQILTQISGLPVWGNISSVNVSGVFALSSQLVPVSGIFALSSQLVPVSGIFALSSQIVAASGVFALSSQLVPVSGIFALSSQIVAASGVFALSSQAGLRPATKVIAAKDSMDKTRADYICNGSTDNTTFQTAINVMTSGGKIICLEGNYIFASTVFGNSHIMIQGTGHQPYWGESTTFFLNHSGSMFAYSGASHGFSFSEIRFNGSGKRFPAIDCYSETGGADNKGCFNVLIERCNFEKLSPAIKARNAWDWWLIGCGFRDCGDITFTSAWCKSQVYVRNTDAGGGAGAFCNHWNVMNNRVDLSRGYFFYSDYNASYPTPNLGMMFTNNAAEGNTSTGYSFVIGVLSHSKIMGNWLAMANSPLIDLSGYSGAGFGNIIQANSVRNCSGVAGVRIGDYYDVVMGNHFFGNTSSDIYIENGSYRNMVSFNTRFNDSGDMVFFIDKGSENTICFNQGPTQWVYVSAPTGQSSHILIKHGGVAFKAFGMV